MTATTLTETFAQSPAITTATARPLTPQSLPHTKIPTIVYRTFEGVARHVANLVAQAIRDANAAGKVAVLGLPTGSTPVGVYRELIRMHREEGFDFSRCMTFNLDEYFPMDPASIHSYRRWMKENFFDHVNIPPENIHIPHGDIPRSQVDAFCAEYERKIAALGGVDLQLLGIGRTGHIGFNEPGSDRDTHTRLVSLDPVTRKDAASDFYGEESVPSQAITMGVGSILAARQVVMMALGEHKARVVRRAVEGEVTTTVAASFLQLHPRACFVLDAASAADLTAVRTPWLVQRVDWTPEMERRAVIWLSQLTKKPLLKLESRDFLEHHLFDLVHEFGPVERIRQRVFDDLQKTICSTPGGAIPQKIIVFSPHPDDDVISMGGTLINLAEQGHDLHVAYMTSGNIAVFDHDADRHLEYVSEFLSLFGLQTPSSLLLEQRIKQQIAHRKQGEPDGEDVLKVKALIRKTEALCAAQTAGVKAEKCHFLDLPFYQTGKVKKNPITDADCQIIVRLLREQKPGQIYLAGDLSDPHGTHRMCAQTILKALDVVAQDGQHPEVWLYRGAWQEYEPHEIERAVPLSPEAMLKKKLAIFKHESQKDAALFPGHDEREFWVRADERTKHTADLFNALGLPEFYALESFKRCDGTL